MKLLEHREERFRTWKELLAVYTEHFADPSDVRKWVYRGEETTTIRSSLDRVLDALSLDRTHALCIEDNLIREFKRRLHHYEPQVPDIDEHVQWLALMQHHGAPTRLVDWTYSFFIATYFALNRTEEHDRKRPGGGGMIIGLDAERGRRVAEERFDVPRSRDVGPEHGPRISNKDFARVFFRPASRPFVYPVTPFRVNPRLTVQQSTFLCPADVRRTFHDNLMALKDPRSTARGRGDFWILHFSGTNRERKEILYHLHRMNITQASLFPGLDGFSESLWLHWSLLGPAVTHLRECRVGRSKGGRRP